MYSTCRCRSALCSLPRFAVRLFASALSRLAMTNDFLTIFSRESVQKFSKIECRRNHARCAASISVWRIQPESVFCSLVFIAFANSFSSASVKRTGTIRPLTSPFASLGRPRFLVLFFSFTIVLYDCRSDYQFRRCLPGEHARPWECISVIYFVSFI